MLIAAGVLALALLAGVVHWLTFRPTRGAVQDSWAQLVAMVALIVAVVLVAVANLRSPEVPWRVLVGLQTPTSSDLEAEPTVTQPTDESLAVAPTIEWATELLPRGAETRLADALRAVIDKERGG